MCEMIQGRLPSAADWDRLRPIFAKFNFFPKPATPNGDRYFVTGAACDCGTALGRSLRQQDAGQHQKQRFEDQIQRHRKNGWSEAKIERWIADVSKGPNALAEGKEREGDNWLSLLKALIEDGPVSSVGLVVYDSGSEEPSSFEKAKRVRLVTVERQTLASMESGQWYVFLP